MRGKNPIRPPVSGDGNILEVKHIFATLQGEGPFVGHPSVFIRLGGCNLACSFCDTQFEDFAQRPVADIVADAEKLAGDGNGARIRHLIVITGGEPFRQNIAPLCERLIAQKFQVQIETNGTLYRKLPEEVVIVCSPKNTGGAYHPLRDDLLQRLQAVKFLISKFDEKYRDIADIGQGRYGTPVYVQPMDEYDPVRNAENLAYAADIAMKRGYRLSLQTHKILGIE